MDDKLIIGFDFSKYGEDVDVMVVEREIAPGTYELLSVFVHEDVRKLYEVLTGKEAPKK